MGSPKTTSKKSMPRHYKCKYCGKIYAMDWALANHEKLCKER